MFLVGKRVANVSSDNTNITKENHNEDNSTAVVEEQVITIIFDRSNFSEKEALDWWNENRRRFV